MDGLIVNVTSFLETLNVHNIHFGIKKPILRLFRNVRYKKMESVLAVSFFKVELKLKLNRHISQGVSSLYICDQSLRKSTTNTERIFIIIQCIWKNRVALSSIIIFFNPHNILFWHQSKINKGRTHFQTDKIFWAWFSKSMQSFRVFCWLIWDDDSYRKVSFYVLSSKTFQDSLKLSIK